MFQAMRRRMGSVATIGVAAALVVAGVAAAQGGSEGGESHGRPPGPPPMGIGMKGLTYAQLHVLNIAEVVALLARAHLPDREHQLEPLATATSMPLLSRAGRGCIGGAPGKPSGRGKRPGDLQWQSTEWKCRTGAYRPADLPRRGGHARGRESLSPSYVKHTSERRRIPGV